MSVMDDLKTIAENMPAVYAAGQAAGGGIDVVALKEKMSKIPFAETDPVEIIETDIATGKVVDKNGDFVSNDTAECCLYEGIEAGKTYLVTGAGNWDYPLYVFKDADGNVINYNFTNDNSEFTGVSNYEVTAPTGAAVLCLNMITADGGAVFVKTEKFEAGVDDLSDEVKTTLVEIENSVAVVKTQIEDVQSAIGIEKTESKNLLDIEDGEYISSNGNLILTATDNVFTFSGVALTEVQTSNCMIRLPFTVPESGKYTLSIFADDKYTNGTNSAFSVQLSNGTSMVSQSLMHINGTQSKIFEFETGVTYEIRPYINNAQSAVDVGSMFDKISFKMQLEKGEVGTEWENPNTTIIKNSYNILNDKKIMCLGDSIMFGSGNGNIGIGDILVDGTTAVLYDYSQGGATITYRSTSDDGTTDYTSGSKQNITYQADLAITEGVTPDIVLVGGGTNDFIKSLEIGEITETYSNITDKSTFSAGLEYILQSLKNAYPSALILYIRTHNLGWSYAKQVEYGNTAVSACEKWSVPVVDLFKNSGFNGAVASMLPYTDGEDKVHPTKEGYERFYIPLILNEIKRHFI